MLRRSLACAALAIVTIAPRARAQTDDGQGGVSSKRPSWFIPEERHFDSVAIEANPLAVAIGLFSANLEVLPAPHHAVVITPQYYFAVPGVSDEITGGGVEGGYRFYTGRYGPEGLFLGGSLLFGSYRYVHRTAVDYPGFDVASDTSYQSFGVAAEGGYQLVVSEHIVLGAGIGVMYRYFTDEPQWETVSHSHQNLFYGSGVRPRFLLSVGGAI
jgi:hypothetical protein